ncbi:MAG: hypothetical protein DCF29_12935 [Alphaproteobacteria bacterium]|nr:MAG: hypothetical protein DCF29_12935 [Alphaproteobacteria bacterium]
MSTTLEPEHHIVGGEAAPVGSSIDIPIQRSDQFSRVRADTISMSRGASNLTSVEVSFLAFENRFYTQKMIVSESVDGIATLKVGSVEGSPILAELASVFMEKSVALDLASTILRHLVTKAGVDPAEILAALDAEGLEFIQQADA